MINIVNVSNITCQHTVNNGGGLPLQIQIVNYKIKQETT